MQVSDCGLRAAKGICVPTFADHHRCRKRVGPMNAHVSGEEILQAGTQQVCEWCRRVGGRIEMVSIVRDGFVTPCHYYGIAGVESFGWQWRIMTIRLVNPIAEHHSSRGERSRKLGVKRVGQDLLLEFFKPYLVRLIPVDPTEGGKIRQVLD